jgi:dephospho-CoA kinase
MAKPTLVGLTGGICSGKSSVGALLAHMGAGWIDADKLAHAVTAAGGSAIPALVKAFGQVCLTPEGAMDRDKMRAIAFADPHARTQLQALTHPLIGQAVVDAIAVATQPVVLLDIPLLVESGRWRNLCDWVVVVDCTEATQLHRIQSRNGWPEAQALAVIRAQTSRSVRLAAADVVLDNGEVRTLTDLKTSATQLGRWLGL